jgi:protein required for attachment to host cells
MKTHWYVVAHRAGARVFEQQGVEKTLTLVKEFDHPEGKLKGSELVSDRQGRFDNGSSGHIAVGSDDTQRTQVAIEFCRKLAEYLETEANKSSFSSLALVAEPHFLGQLRKAIGKGSVSRLTQEVAKDLVNVSDHQMAEQLSGILCTRESVQPGR